MKMKAKKLPPSSRPTAFAPASVLSRKMRSGSSGTSTRVSITRKATTSVAGRCEQRDRPRGRPAVLRRLRQRVDEQQQPGGDAQAAERVVAALDRVEPALWDDRGARAASRPHRSGR